MSTVTERITLPLRNICSLVLRQPESIINLEDTIMKFFDFTKDSVTHVTMIPLEDLKMVLTETEKFSNPDLVNKTDGLIMKVSPNSPLA